MSSSDQKDIAVIVPVYNVEKYISECLDSLLGQNFSGTKQIILVDDCSPDHCDDICRDYVKKHPDEIIYIRHKKNLGSSMARNSGLDAVVAKFFVFVDPDDYVPEGALSVLFSNICDSGADIVKGNNYLLHQSSVKPANYNVSHTLLIEGDDCLTELLAHKKVRGHPWGKIFRTSTVGDIRFTPGYTMAQDLLYCSKVFAKARVFKLIPDVVYHYRIHDSGATGRKYETNAYKWWFKSVEDLSLVCKTSAHYRQHTTLQIRTILQAAREIRSLQSAMLMAVLEDIEFHRLHWGLSLKGATLAGIQSMFRYLRYLRLRNQLRAKG
jgi:glycosyltransferase involved in cell wall biosynthesis